MTKPKNDYAGRKPRFRPTRAEIAALPDRILACMRRVPTWTVQELSDELGFSICGIRSKLLEFSEQGKAHQIRARAHNGGGSLHFWKLGPAPIAPKQEIKVDDEEPAALYLPNQRILKVYPSVDRRDDLVAALFGPARREAA